MIEGHELFETWAKAQDLFYQRAERVVQEAIDVEYPDCDLDSVNGLDYDDEDDSVIIVGGSRNWCSVDTPSHFEISLFRVPREDFLDPERWTKKMQEYDEAQRRRDEYERAQLEERERAEYLRLKAKFEK